MKTKSTTRKIEVTSDTLRTMTHQGLVIGEPTTGRISKGMMSDTQYYYVCISQEYFNRLMGIGQMIEGCVNEGDEDLN